MLCFSFHFDRCLSIAETMVNESVNEKKIKEVLRIWAGVLHKDKFKRKRMDAGQAKLKPRNCSYSSAV